MSPYSTEELLAALPYARRYARALVGSQAEGDKLVARAMAAPGAELPARLALYAGISRLAPGTGYGALGVQERQLLLLTALEEMPVAEAGSVLGLAVEEATARLADARAALKAEAVADVLIIEDEPVIALDLQQLVESCGHRVTGIASSEAEAIRLAAERHTGLILADINLGRGGNGIAAVRRILENVQVPVIFVTAYPEKLLTAEGMEPAFVISKPFDPMTLAVATYQATTAGRVPLN